MSELAQSGPLTPSRSGILAAVLLAVAAQGAASEFLTLDSRQLERLVQKVGVPGGELVGMSARGAGAELLLTFRTNQVSSPSEPFLLAIVSEGGIRFKPIPADAAWFDDEGRPLCRYSGSPGGRWFVFTGGEKLPHDPGAITKFSPDGTVFFVSFLGPTNGAPLFRTASPLEPVIRLPEHFAPQTVFVRANEIFVFGQRNRPHARLGDRTDCWGLVLSIRGERVSLDREMDLSRFGAVLDMDTQRGTLLVDSRRDTLRTWGLYDPALHKYKSLGLMRSQGFFLDPEFARYLSGLWDPR